MIIPISRIKEVSIHEKAVEDIVEISNSHNLTFNLEEIERMAGQNCSENEKIRQAIVLHEAGSKLSGLSKDKRRAFFLRSYDLLTDLSHHFRSQDILPIVTAYRASVLTRLSIENGRWIDIKNAFRLFDEAIRLYSDVSGLPEFLRARCAMSLPWYWFNKKKYARNGFISIINKQAIDSEHVLLFRLKSFSHYGMAVIINRWWNRRKVLAYLNNAIFLDPNFLAAREDAEHLRSRLMN